MSLSVKMVKRLGDFTLDVAFETNGGVTGLLGASGCGKSYTLRCIAGVATPDEGRIVLDDTVLFDSAKHINLPPQQRHVGYLFQNYALFPNMTVRQNILCGLHGEKNRDKREQALSSMLAMLQLQGLEKHRPSQLSGGQAQRVALARILVSQPQLLMLDEPFSALDTYLRQKLLLEMRELLTSFGKDVLLVTHSRDEAYQLCASIAVMDAGHVLTRKDTRALFADPESVGAALLTGCKNIVAARKIGEHEADIPAWGVRLTTAQPLRDGLTAIGIRAHDFSPDCEENRLPIDIVGSMEEPFEWIVRFRYAGQQSEPVWWRVAKGRGVALTPERLGVPSSCVLPLYA